MQRGIDGAKPSVHSKHNDGDSTSNDTEEASCHGGKGGTTGESGNAWGSSGDSGAVLGSRGSGVSGTGSLDLAIRDLGNNSCGCSLGDSTGGLDLTVGDLRNNSCRCSLDNSRGGLDLTVRNLGHGSSGAGSLDLAIRNLRDGAGSSGRFGSSRYGINTAGGDDLNVDGRALVTGALIVQVVKVTTEALVEDGRAAKGESAVAADGPASSVDSTGLRWLIKLELVVRGNVTNAAFVISEDTVCEGDRESLAL